MFSVINSMRISDSDLPGIDMGHYWYYQPFSDNKRCILYPKNYLGFLDGGCRNFSKGALNFIAFLCGGCRNFLKGAPNLRKYQIGAGLLVNKLEILGWGGLDPHYPQKVHYVR